MLGVIPMVFLSFDTRYTWIRTLVDWCTAEATSIWLSLFHTAFENQGEPNCRDNVSQIFLSKTGVDTVVFQLRFVHASVSCADVTSDKVYHIQDKTDPLETPFYVPWLRSAAVHQFQDNELYPPSQGTLVELLHRRRSAQKQPLHYVCL